MMLSSQMLGVMATRAGWSLEEKGVAYTLLVAYGQASALPSDPEIVAHALGLPRDRVAKVWPVLFRQDDQGRLVLALPAKPRKAPAQPDEAWLAGLQPAYPALDVQQEAARCRVWCETHRKPYSRARVVNWLNRAIQPMAPRSVAGPRPLFDKFLRRGGGS